MDKVAVTHQFNVSRPALVGREKEYVLNALEKEELSWHGEYLRRFEEAFALFCEVPRCAATCNGTAALHLALMSVGVGPGWYVLLPALTYVATANAVVYCGATPVFCDVDPLTWCLDSQDVAKKLHVLKAVGGGRVLLPVHLYGVPADMGALNALASEYHALVVEDAAEAHGAIYKGQTVGGIGHVGAFSFYANKILTTGEGGAVTTHDQEIDSRVRLLRGQGTTPGSFDHVVIGFNYRMTNLQAAIGLAQIESAGFHITSRHRCCAWYREALKGRYQVQETSPECLSADWMMSVLLPSGRNEIRRRLSDVGIETRALFTPLTALPIYAGPTPRVCADLAARGINLPTHGELTKEDVYHIVDELHNAVGAVC